MTSGRYGLVLREVGRLLGGGTAASLGASQLLERFAADRDPAAFEALVGRHGPMVLGTCRRMLSDPLDVEDAFQATFLVLARKAGSIQDADRLGPWLHGVARRVAARSRALSSRRKSLERQDIEEPAAESPDLLERLEIREALDEELARLPEKYRAPLVLCYLEGLTHDEAAEALRWPVGTVRSRLAGGRDRLRARLTRRGLAPSAAVPALLPSGALSPTLISTTVRVATTAGSPSAHVLNLAKGALIAMAWNQWKAVAVVGLMAGLTVGAAGVVAQQGEAGKAEAPAAKTSKDQPSIEGEADEDRGIADRLYRLERREEDLQHQLKLAEMESSELDITFNTLGLDLEWARWRIKSYAESIKDLEGKLAAKVAENQAKRARFTPAPKPPAVDDRIKQLEKQVAEQKAVIQSLQGPGNWPASRPLAKDANAVEQAPSPPADQPKREPISKDSEKAKEEVAPGGTVGLEGGTAKPAVPAPQPELHDLPGDPKLFAAISADRNADFRGRENNQSSYDCRGHW
jgi:RNA polymerase sigma factor (sigma-70 family)